MRVHPLALAASLLPGALLLAQQPDPSQDPNCCGDSMPAKRVFRDAVTHKQLAPHHGKQVNPIASLPTVPAPDPIELEEPPVPVSILSRSEILQANGMATLVPKRAILHVPETLRGALSRPEGAELLVWRDFYAANRSWIDTVEVNRAQAEGWKALPEEFVASLEDRSKVVVAVMQGGPISVMPVAEPEPAPFAEKETE